MWEHRKQCLAGHQYDIFMGKDYVCYSCYMCIKWTFWRRSGALGSILSKNKLKDAALCSWVVRVFTIGRSIKPWWHLDFQETISAYIISKRSSLNPSHSLLPVVLGFLGSPVLLSVLFTTNTKRAPTLKQTSTKHSDVTLSVCGFPQNYSVATVRTVRRFFPKRAKEFLLYEKQNLSSLVVGFTFLIFFWSFLSWSTFFLRVKTLSLKQTGTSQNINIFRARKIFF